jgi:hypothetical protein
LRQQQLLVAVKCVYLSDVLSRLLTSAGVGIEAAAAFGCCQCVYLSDVLSRLLTSAGVGTEAGAAFGCCQMCLSWTTFLVTLFRLSAFMQQHNKQGCEHTHFCNINNFLWVSGTNLAFQITAKSSFSFSGGQY